MEIEQVISAIKAGESIDYISVADFDVTKTTDIIQALLTGQQRGELTIVDVLHGLEVLRRAYIRAIIKAFPGNGSEQDKQLTEFYTMDYATAILATARIEQSRQAREV